MNLLNFFTKEYSLQDLTTVSKKIIINRSNYRIAIIDDERVPLIEQLIPHNYNITYFEDISVIDQLNNFQIIICDIEGVGKKFGSKYGGAHLIKEIRNNDPLKYIIAFSSKSFDMSFNDFFKECDNAMEKHLDITQWTTSLDIAIKSINNPIFMWEKVRNALLKNNINLSDVSKIERAYIKSILKKDSSYFNKISKSNFNYGNTITTIDAIGTYLQLLIPIMQ
jgi:hypothetical protein